MDGALARRAGRLCRYASNIVFSNGGFDPWSRTGVTSTVSRSVIAVTIPEGAHHLDLFFEHPDDPGSVRAARSMERREMRRWVDRAYAGAAEKGAADDKENSREAWKVGVLKLSAAAAAGMVSMCAALAPAILWRRTADNAALHAAAAGVGHEEEATLRQPLLPSSAAAADGGAAAV